MVRDPDVPAGWLRRLPIIVSAAVGYLFAGNLATIRYGVFPTVCGPFLGAGGVSVLNSPVSGLPVSDVVARAGGPRRIAEGCRP